MGIEQAGAQVNRSKWNYKPPENQTKFKDETRIPYRKISKQKLGRKTSKWKHIHYQRVITILINIISNSRYYLCINFIYFTSKDVKKNLPQNNHKYIKLKKEAINVNIKKT